MTGTAVDQLLEGRPSLPHIAEKPSPPAAIFPQQEGIFNPEMWKEWITGTTFSKRCCRYREASFPGEEFARKLSDSALGAAEQYMRVCTRGFSALSAKSQ